MKKISEAWFGNNNNGTCYCCGKKTTNNVRITEDGYVSRSYSLDICESHIKTIKIGDSWFSKVNGELFYEYNSEYGMFGFLRNITTKAELDYYINKNTIEFLHDVYLD